MGNDKIYQNIVRHYEDCLMKFGDTNQGVDWPNVKDAQLRYKIMMDITKDSETDLISLLDFGCGTAQLLEYIRKHLPVANIEYTGLDISEKFIEVASKKFPANRFINMDILDSKNGPAVLIIS
jgi:trans-aconitate methyltransferase